MCALQAQVDSYVSEFGGMAGNCTGKQPGSSMVLEYTMLYTEAQSEAVSRCVHLCSGCALIECRLRMYLCTLLSGS